MSLFHRRIAIASNKAVQYGFSKPYFRPFTTFPVSRLARNWTAYGGVVGGTALCFGLYYNYSVSRIVQESSLEDVNPKYKKLFPEDTWQPDNTTVDPFLRRVSVDGQEFWLLGLGVRSVSFLKLQVYAVGIYVEKDDLQNLLATISSAAGAETDLSALILDQEQGLALFSKLFDSNVRFALRIVPVRNTDFGHLRDGFVRSVMASLRSRNMTDLDPSTGISELRNAMSRKLSVPKNGELMLTMDKNGELYIRYHSAKANSKPEALGKVTDKTVIKALFLHYMTAPAAASESARNSMTRNLVELIKQ
ncbi:chalcone-flavanone isomerase-domain-containing protein [Lipomyces oligophaga]|uniref:chalcone-flavanone isomerase-domain-containing protein n=1 Tax=Lipomyces oligophaga TaxID=45792 RepID=UPI0034CDC228